MLQEQVAQLLNEQVNKEFFSAYLYLAISNYFTDEGLNGFANWYKVQFQEEQDHALLLMQYLQNNDVAVTLEAIAKPNIAFKNYEEALNAVLGHERYITSQINKIYGAAYDVRDFRTMQFLDWFVKEQGEEERNSTDLIKRMELFGKDAKGLYEIDKELESRTYTAPSVEL